MSLTGDSSAYYSVIITSPTVPDKCGYVAECNDIIEALGMNFAEGNILKAVWRTAAARQGNGKAGHTALYDAEKIVFFGERLIAQYKGEGVNKYSDEQIYDWLKQNEHSIEGNSYDGHEIVTVWGTYGGPSIRAIMTHVLDTELSYEEQKQMALEGI